jgi:hypothetical protein
MPDNLTIQIEVAGSDFESPIETFNGTRGRKSFHHSYLETKKNQEPRKLSGSS